MIKAIVPAIALLLAACGGSGGAGDRKIPFGWWNGQGPVSGSLSIAVPSEYPAAIERGQLPIVIVWTSIQQGSQLVPGWRDNLRALVASTPKAAGYYALDEPGLHGISAADQAAVVEALPQDRIIMLSLSRPEIDAGQRVPPGVNLLGVALYASAGVTPAQATQYLDRLAAYGRPMYLHLDAAWITERGASCKHVPEAPQRAAMALNDAIRAWGSARDIRALVAFLWQSGDDGANQVCGAVDMPLVREYLESLT